MTRDALRTLVRGTLRLALPMIASVTLPLAAQSARARTAPIPDSTNSAPIYPAVLEESGVGGTVHVQFVVDTTGRVHPANVVVRLSPNDVLTQSVTNVVSRWRFTPASIGGRVTSDTVDLLVDFVPTPSALYFLQPTLVARESLGPRRWKMTIGIATQSTPTPVADSLHLAIATAVLDTVLASNPVNAAYPPRIACIALRMSGVEQPPPLALLRALSNRNYTAVAARRCPPTFGSMVRIQSADGRPPAPDPPGEDPWTFTVFAPAKYGSAVAVDVELAHATMGSRYHCAAIQDVTRSNGWRARCKVGEMWVH